MPKSIKMARLIVRYGKHKEGETIRGDLAAQLIAQGMATDITPKPSKAPKAKKAPAAPENKNAGAAPENKGDGFKV